jgi:hypothetical protein
MRHFHHFIFVPHWHVVAPWRWYPCFAFHGGGGAGFVFLIIAVVWLVLVAASFGRSK